MIAGLTRQKEELKAIIPHKEESLIRAVLPLTSIKVTNFISTDRQLLGTCRSAFHRKLPTLLFISDTSVQKIAAYSDILLPTLLRAHRKTRLGFIDTQKKACQENPGRRCKKSIQEKNTNLCLHSSELRRMHNTKIHRF